MSFLDKLFGDPNVREVKKLEPIVALINDLEKDYEKLTDDDLRLKTKDFKQRIANGDTLDDILPEAFAAVREAGKRALGQRHYDVQLMAGIILHQGKIAEMRTGEGKTLVATLPLYLNALSGKGCHLVTTNDYLARVGGGWMAPVYHALGISIGVIAHEYSARFNPKYLDPHDHGDDRLNHWEPCSRHEAYLADITYGTNNEFGFDYLRDNMAVAPEQLAQRDLNFAIVDEVDSILIDEARTPLIISAPAEESASLYQRFAALIPQLSKDKDFKVDEKERTATLTDDGIKKMEQLLNLPNIYDPKNIALIHHLEEALKAHALFRRDKDYVVKDGEVIIVDEFTGRLMQGRRYSEGLHQAIEAKEGVEVKKESDTLATITFQNLFRMYNKLSGMTGTAATEAEEFYKIYKLDVLEIPTNREMVRIDKEDLIYKTRQGKLSAIINDVKERNAKGQPILIGTISIQKNEELFRLLKRNGVKHQLLNAKQHEKEAKTIADAGKVGAVTVATNMAGRGVDIILGGKFPEKGTKEEIKKWEEEHAKVLKLGGLYVIGTERHEARRIDNQLRGRAGRQGDAGESQFYASMEDDLMRIFGGERMQVIMERLGLPDDQPIKHKMISGSIESAQKKVEGHNFDIRKHLVEYDDVMNKHREVIYRKRRKILFLDPKKDNWLHEEIKTLLDENGIKTIYEKEKQIGLENWRQVERMVYLRAIDSLWIEHLNTMTELRESVGLKGYAQKDPLVVYKEEGFHTFTRLLKSIEVQVADILTKLQIEARPTPPNVVEASPIPQKAEFKGADENLASGGIQAPELVEEPIKQTNPANSGVTVSVRQTSDPKSSQPQTRAYAKVGRNDPCPCGSGKKYKKCHGK